MASEKFANLAETTLASGYTSGTTTLSVSSAAGFPTVGVFRVRLGNAGKTIWRVDSVSGTTFTGAAEANDANANAGDTVAIVASKAVAERFVQSPESGEPRLISGVGAADFYGPIFKLTALDQSAWSWVNQGSATVDQSAGHVHLNMPAASAVLRARVVAAPGTPYTITIALTMAALVTGTGAVGYGVCFRESGTSKLLIFGFRVLGNIPSQVTVERWTNETTFSASSASPTAATALPSFLRIIDNGTNLIYEISWDGHHYTQVFSEGRTVFMAGGPNQIGIFGRSDNLATAGTILSWVQS